LVFGFGVFALTSAFALFGAQSGFAAPKAAKEVTHVFSPSASVVKWHGKKVTGEHDGAVQLQKGSIVMKGDQLKSGEFIIDMKTISVRDIEDPSNNTKLVNHLKSADFFEVDRYPTAVLKVKKVKSVEGFTGPTFEVTADLTLKGKTHPIEFPAMIKTEDGKTTATANITLDRTKWNVRYGSGKFFKGLGDKMIHDEFTLDVALATK
jgi:polyisoprenoid-binding protein YceI